MKPTPRKSIENALPPIFDGIPIIYEDDQYVRPSDMKIAQLEADFLSLKEENRRLKVELATLRKKNDDKGA